MNFADHIAHAIAAGFETIVEAALAAHEATSVDSLDFAMFDAPVMGGSQLLRDIARSDRTAARRMGWAA